MKQGTQRGRYSRDIGRSASWAFALRLQRARISFTRSCTSSRASCRSSPRPKSSSYWVSVWRTCAVTAKRIASESNAFALAERPTRPLYFRQACSAILAARNLGQRGNRRTISAVKLCTYSWSFSAACSCCLSLRCSRASASARHVSSACRRPSSVTSSPCRSYRLRDLLHLRTMADSTECFFARRLKQASPEGRNTR